MASPTSPTVANSDKITCDNTSTTNDDNDDDENKDTRIIEYLHENPSLLSSIPILTTLSPSQKALHISKHLYFFASIIYNFQSTFYVPSTDQQNRFVRMQLAHHRTTCLKEGGKTDDEAGSAVKLLRLSPRMILEGRKERLDLQKLYQHCVHQCCCHGNHIENSQSVGENLVKAEEHARMKEEADRCKKKKKRLNKKKKKKKIQEQEDTMHQVERDKEETSLKHIQPLHDQSQQKEHKEPVYVETQHLQQQHQQQKDENENNLSAQSPHNDCPNLQNIHEMTTALVSSIHNDDKLDTSAHKQQKNIEIRDDDEEEEASYFKIIQNRRRRNDENKTEDNRNSYSNLSSKIESSSITQEKVISMSSSPSSHDNKNNDYDDTIKMPPPPPPPGFISQELAAEVAAFTARVRQQNISRNGTDNTITICTTNVDDDNVNNGVSEKLIANNNSTSTRTNANNNTTSSSSSYLEAVKSSSTYSPYTQPPPPPISSSSTTTSDSNQTLINQLQQQIKTQQREHLERIQQVQLKAFIAETKAQAVEERCMFLEDLLADALVELLLRLEGEEEENEKSALTGVAESNGGSDTGKRTSFLEEILEEVIDLIILR